MSEKSAKSRDDAVALVHSDIVLAEAAAVAVEDPWYRAQALAWVARYAPDDDVMRVARLALAAASDCEDAYRQAGASAWVLRALMERDRRDEALAMLEMVLPSVPRITPPSSRAEALFLLLQAVFDSTEEIRRSLLFALASVYDEDAHWRIERNYRAALVMMQTVDPEFAQRMAQGRDEEQRRRLERALAGAAHEPRAFFW